MRIGTALLVTTVALGALAARADQFKAHHQKSFAPKPGGTLKVDATFHAVTVAFSPSASTVDVTVDLDASLWPGDARAYADVLKPSFDEAATGITIRSKAKGRWTSGVNRSTGRIAVVMPPGMALDLSTGSGEIKVMGDTGGRAVSCETGSGEVVVEGRASDLKVGTASGGVRVRLEGPCDQVRLEAGSGRIEFRGGASNLFAKTGSGAIDAEGLLGPARLQAGSGSVHAAWDALAAGASVEVGTGSGGVTLSLPSGVSPAGTLQTSSGAIESEFPGTYSPRRTSCTLSGLPPGPVLRIETGSGGIHLTKR